MEIIAAYAYFPSYRWVLCIKLNTVADLVTVLIGPHQYGDPSQDVHLVTIIVGGAPAQRHGQGVSEGLLSIAASGQTQRLDIPGKISYRGSGSLYGV